MSIEMAALKLGAGKYAYPLERACLEYGILERLDKAHFFAQMMVESAGFTRVRENLNYSTTALLSLFGRHRITAAQAERFGRNDRHIADKEAIANTIYGGEFGREQLGNTKPGDGWRFIGRGLKQLTGRDNATRYSISRYGDGRIAEDPALLEENEDACMSAGWFWHSKKIHELAMRDDLEAVTRKVNGGLNGLDDRRAALVRAKEVFGA